MSSTTAVMLQDRLNDVERNICDGIDFRQELNEAYALADELQAENEKLRELVRDYERCNMHADCDRCEYDGTTSTHCPLSPCFPDTDELRELGVEVD